VRSRAFADAILVPAEVEAEAESQFLIRQKPFHLAGSTSLPECTGCSNTAWQYRYAMYEESILSEGVHLDCETIRQSRGGKANNVHRGRGRGRNRMMAVSQSVNMLRYTPLVQSREKSWMFTLC
jgi:hypothetical protein